MGIRLALCALTALAVATPAAADYKTRYDDYRKAFEAGDLAKAVDHTQKAWREAEIALGDHKTTAILALNYANVVYDTDPAKALAAFERALAITEKGIGALNAAELRLNIAVARVAADRRDDGDVDILHSMLDAHKESGAAATYYTAEGWKIIALSEFRKGRYYAARKASDRALVDAETLDPRPGRLIAEALTLGAVADLMNESRRDGKQIAEAIERLDRAIVMFPMQESIDTIDPLLAKALLWRATAGAIARSGGSSETLRSVDEDLDADARARMKMKDTPACPVDWERQDKPAYPAEAKNDDEVGAVLIGFDLLGDRIERTVVIAEHSGGAFKDAALSAMKTWRTKEPVSNICRKNHVIVFSFSLR